MRISAKTLKNVENVNFWQYTSQVYANEGQANSLFIQLVDLDKPLEENPKNLVNPSFPLRYISTASVLAVSATFESIDDSQEFVIVGSQPFAGDKSIWKFDLSASQTPNSGSIKITITEDGVAKSFIVNQAISVIGLNQGHC